MDLYINGISIYLGMLYEDIPIERRKCWRITNFESEGIILLRTNLPVLYKNREFGIKLCFLEGRLDSVTLDGRLGNSNFYEAHEEDKKWLRDNFGKPTEEKQWGEIYNFDEFQIISEVDPRGMDAQITFRLKSQLISLDIIAIDAIGIVDGQLELLLLDPNPWLPDTEHDHLLKLQEKINNYIHYLESKQYVAQYGDQFDKKVINITFKYSPSDNGLAFLVQVQKALQHTDMSLKVVFPN